jgi:integrase
MSKKINFTIIIIKSIPNAKEGSRDYYYDTKTPGLGIMVFPSGTKTFFLYKRVDGKPDKIKLGRFPEVSIEQARNAALAGMNDIAKGINPNKEKQRLRNETTFAKLAERFINEYAKERKKSWENDLGYYTNHLKPLDNKKISMITRSNVEKLHNEIKNKTGLYAANRSLALLKTMFNRAIDWGFDGNNPAAKIKKFPEQARDRALQPHELNNFFEALNNEPSIIFRDYIYLSLLTGARRSNVLAMRWEHLTFGDASEWRIPITKNGEAQIISLVPQAIEILQELKEQSNSEWVFPSTTSKSGHIEEPKKVWKRILQQAGITDLRIHDLRRTMASWQVRTGANSFVIGKTLGHKSQQATAIYARVSKDVARESMENAVNAMFKYGKQ